MTKKYGKWIESSACQSRAHCKNCLRGNLGSAFEEQYEMPEPGTCPHGVTLDNLPEKPKKVKTRPDGRKDYTNCKSCKEKMKREMKGD